MLCAVSGLLVSVSSDPEPGPKHNMPIALTFLVSSSEEKEKNAELQFSGRVRRRGKVAGTDRPVYHLSRGKDEGIDGRGRGTGPLCQ